MRNDAPIIILAEWAARTNAETRRVMGVSIGPELPAYSPLPDEKHRLRRWAQEYLSDLMDDAEAAACAAADLARVREIRECPNDEYEGLPWTFAEACRRADEKRRRKRVDPAIERARWLMDDDKVVSIEAAYAAFERERRKHGAARSTIEALMFSLRARGTAALIERDTRRRISERNEAQLIEVGDWLQLLKPEIARAWTPDEVRALVDAWRGLHVV